jgi:hypothetical protein
MVLQSGPLGFLDLVNQHGYQGGWRECTMYNWLALRWPRDLRLGSAISRLLGFRFRVSPGAWMSVVSVECFQVEVSTKRRSLVQGSPTECVTECDRVKY